MLDGDSVYLLSSSFVDNGYGSIPLLSAQDWETGVTVARLNLAQKEGFRLPRFLRYFGVVVQSG